MYDAAKHYTKAIIGINGLIESGLLRALADRERNKGDAYEQLSYMQRARDVGDEHEFIQARDELMRLLSTCALRRQEEVFRCDLEDATGPRLGWADGDREGQEKVLAGRPGDGMLRS